MPLSRGTTLELLAVPVWWVNLLWQGKSGEQSASRTPLGLFASRLADAPLARPSLGPLSVGGSPMLPGCDDLKGCTKHEDNRRERTEKRFAMACLSQASFSLSCLPLSDTSL